MATQAVQNSGSAAPAKAPPSPSQDAKKAKQFQESVNNAKADNAKADNAKAKAPAASPTPANQNKAPASASGAKAPAASANAANKSAATPKAGATALAAGAGTASAGANGDAPKAGTAATNGNTANASAAGAGTASAGANGAAPKAGTAGSNGNTASASAAGAGTASAGTNGAAPKAGTAGTNDNTATASAAGAGTAAAGANGEAPNAGTPKTDTNGNTTTASAAGAGAASAGANGDAPKAGSNDSTANASAADASEASAEAGGATSKSGSNASEDANNNTMSTADAESGAGVNVDAYGSQKKYGDPAYGPGDWGPNWLRLSHNQKAIALYQVRKMIQERNDLQNSMATDLGNRADFLLQQKFKVAHPGDDVGTFVDDVADFFGNINRDTEDYTKTSKELEKDRGRWKYLVGEINKFRDHYGVRNWGIVDTARAVGRHSYEKFVKAGFTLMDAAKTYMNRADEAAAAFNYNWNSTRKNQNMQKIKDVMSKITMGIFTVTGVSTIASAVAFAGPAIGLLGFAARDVAAVANNTGYTLGSGLGLANTNLRQAGKNYGAGFNNYRESTVGAVIKEYLDQGLNVGKHMENLKKRLDYYIWENTPPPVVGTKRVAVGTGVRGGYYYKNVPVYGPKPPPPPKPE